MLKKYRKILFILVIQFISVFVLSGCSIKNVSENINENINAVVSENNLNNIDVEKNLDPFEYLTATYSEGNSYITSKEQIELKNTDGKGKTYSFKYNDEMYTAIYTKDNWQIKNSYKIRNKNDITIICQALIEIHPVHGKDMKSYRAAEDMMDEWVIHNIAYDYLPDSNSWKSHAKDVDLNPADQGKSLKEMYEERFIKGK